MPCTPAGRADGRRAEGCSDGSSPRRRHRMAGALSDRWSSGVPSRRPTASRFVAEARVVTACRVAGRERMPRPAEGREPGGVGRGRTWADVGSATGAERTSSRGRAGRRMVGMRSSAVHGRLAPRPGWGVRRRRRVGYRGSQPLHDRRRGRRRRLPPRTGRVDGLDPQDSGGRAVVGSDRRNADGATEPEVRTEPEAFPLL